MGKMIRVPLQSMFAAMGRNCDNCINRQVRRETVRYQNFSMDGVTPIPGSFTEATFTTERCRKDDPKEAGQPHPFGTNWTGAVLTCREMRLNDCGKEAKFFVARIAER